MSGTPPPSNEADRVPERASDDASGAEHWVRHYQRPLTAYAASLLVGDWAAAQDAVQDTFLRYCDPDRTTPTGDPAAWLFTVCRRRVIDMRRKKHATPVDPGDVAIADPAPGPAATTIAAEERRTLAEKIDALTPRQSEVLRLKLSGDLSYREIADVTGLSVSNVGFHLHAAMKSLRGAALANQA